MKRCSKCKEIKPKSEFSPLKAGRDGVGVWCRSCKNEYNRKYNPSRTRRRRTRENKARALVYLGSACLCCGDILEGHNMEFHHIPERGEKSFGIGTRLEGKWKQ